MRFSSLFGPTAAELALLVQLWPVVNLIRPTQGVNFTPVPSPNLDLQDLGRVALTGDFDSISLYTYQQQSEDSFSTNGTQSLITQLPNGDFATTAAADGYIKAMCPFIMHDGTNAGVIVGGNFTSLGGVEAQGVAMYGPSTGKITPLPGLTGIVNALLCDQETNTVYVGGAFKGANSTNAVAWVGMSGWANLPFQGFNGPVNSILPAPSGNVIFGGSFTSLGNSTTTTPNQKDQQIINISSANITTGGTSTTDGYNNGTSIVCKTNGGDGPGNTWLLADNTPGFWRADMNFGYEPTKLRLWNTHQDGRGTQTFRFTALPLNGIMNFTYTDPDTGKKDQFCDARCPMSADKSVLYQDFYFYNTVGMSAFRIDVSAWHGKGGGFDGIELFENDIFAYAIDSLNEPACTTQQSGSNSTATGPWTVSPSLQSISEYLTASLTGSNINGSGVSVIFEPNIMQKANYTVTMFTPGCLQDNSCDSRGIVNVTGNYATASAPGVPLQTQIYQTNNYDKYDTIYQGPVDLSSGGFRPTVTLAPLYTQNDPITLVAQRVQFSIGNSTGGLNGLYEFNPNQNTLDTDFSNSTIDQAGLDLEQGAIVNSIALSGPTMYIAGNFTDSNSGFANIFAIGSGNSTGLPNGGLNAEVSSVIAYEDILYLGGNFTNTLNGSIAGLNNVAAFNITSSQWQPLGAGVSGAVDSIVPLEVNVTQNQPETCITINGFFNNLKSFGSNNDMPVTGFGIWVPSRQNWLQNLNVRSQAITGQLSTMTNVSGSDALLAGTLSSQDMSADDAVYLTSNPTSLNPLNVGIQPESVGPVTRKRAISGQNVSGVVTGLFHTSSANVTVLGGHFTATATNGSTIDNLAFVNGTSNAVTGLAAGLDTDSAFLALATSGNVLYAGGTITGKVNSADVNGLIVFDLGLADYSHPQPPAFGGNNVAVNAITVRPNKPQVYVGGTFETAGSLGCPSVCVFENGAWNQPGSGIGGSVAAFTWQGNDKLLAGGNLTVNNNATSLANLDISKNKWTVVDGAAVNVPGPVTALAPANKDASQFWVAGKSNNGTAFLVKYDGSTYHPVGDSLGSQTTILGLSMLQLSKGHDSNDLVPSRMALLVTGKLDLPNFGNASAALFNGTTFSPFILSTQGNNPGSISQLFSEKEVKFTAAGKYSLSSISLLYPR